jgi:hypothetical protein
MTANQISFGLPALQHTTTKGVNKRETKDENKLRRKRNVSPFELTVSTVIRSTARPGAKLGTIHREVAALSHLFTKAVEWKWLTGSLATIKRLAEDFGRISSLTVENGRGDRPAYRSRQATGRPTGVRNGNNRTKGTPIVGRNFGVRGLKTPFVAPSVLFTSVQV